MGRLNLRDECHREAAAVLTVPLGDRVVAIRQNLSRLGFKLGCNAHRYRRVVVKKTRAGAVASVVDNLDAHYLVLCAPSALRCHQSEPNQSARQSQDWGVASVRLCHVRRHELVLRSERFVSNDETFNVIVVLFDFDPLDFIGDLKALAEVVA